MVSSPPLKKIVMGSLVSVELYTLEKERQTVYTEVSTYLKRGILFPGITQCISKLKMREMPVYMHIM